MKNLMKGEKGERKLFNRREKSEDNTKKFLGKKRNNEKVDENDGHWEEKDRTKAKL